jgi:hypothetical protein
MSEPFEKFDPYQAWLAIPPGEQPPHHYRLLGLSPFERNPDTIDNAADRQTMHVREHSTGKLARFAHRLLNEISAAKLCLLDKHRKAAYDDSLKEKLDRAAKKAAAKIPPPPPPRRSTLKPPAKPPATPPRIPSAAETARVGRASATPCDEILAAVEYSDALPAEAAVGVSQQAVANAPPKIRWR